METQHDPKTYVDDDGAMRHPYLDAHRIADRLWLGSYPFDAIGTKLSDFRFDALVLCAIDKQSAVPFINIDVEKCPLHDTQEEALSDADWAKVVRTANRVATRIRRGERVLVTCQAGINRSSLVLAKAMQFLYPEMSMKQIITMIRQKRNSPLGLMPLFNERFVEALLTRS